MHSAVWERVGELADRAPQISDLRHHKLQLVAAARMRERGETVPSELVAEQRVAAAIALAVPVLLRRVRAVCDGPLVLMKGAEAAARWPEPRLRPAKDIDLLVEDADTVQAALLSAGFVEVEDPTLYDELHHHCPLVLPGFPLTVEVHRQPHWCDGTPPAIGRIVAAAQPCALGVDGILAPRADHHAVLLGAHAWAHGPLDRIGPLADVAAMRHESGHEAAAAVADDWGLSNAWRATSRAIDELLAGEPTPHRTRVWKRHLADARERTVFEEHVTRIVAPVTAAPARCAPVALAAALATAARPYPEEGWRSKLTRASHAIRHPAWSRSQHEAMFEVPTKSN
jgi:putative nucleotidyltransferase-like protein